MPDDGSRIDARSEGAIVEPAPAKLNLDLYIEARRPDGYHLLDSVVVFTQFGDDLTLEPAAEFAVAIDGPLAPALTAAGETLVDRAIQLAAQRFEKPARFDIRLTKRIPLAAGLGGGSADAAAALRAAWRFWFPDRPISDGMPELIALATQLGADVPVCVLARPATMRGIGEVLSPAPDIPPLHLVLANPGVDAATGAIFKNLDPQRFEAAPERHAEPRTLGLPAWLVGGANMMTDAACAVQPAIAEVLTALNRSAPPVVRMAGSGATCFAIVADAPAARALAADIRRAQPSWWVVATETLARP